MSEVNSNGSTASVHLRRKLSNQRSRFIRNLYELSLDEARRLLEIESPEERRELFLLTDPGTALNKMMLGMLDKSTTK